MDCIFDSYILLLSSYMIYLTKETQIYIVQLEINYDILQMRNLSKQKNPFRRSRLTTPLRHCSSAKYCSVRGYQQCEQWIRIGKYKILLDEVLGKGYSSKVYRGVEVGRELKSYAVKAIELKGFSATCLKLFQRQIEIHRTLDHEHIVRCYDVFRTETHIYMVMEYCPHGDLSQFIKQKKKVPEHVVADIMGQILRGYRHLASLKILHRDLKPSNILRSGKIWKIADFGFAVRAITGFTDNLNVGTPMYMPIESLSSSYYSIKSDIFALGVILYELTHGRVPWSSRSQTQLLRKMCNNKLKIETSLTNHKILQFIVNACEISQENRLSQEQLQSFSFTNGDESLTSPIFHHSASYSTSSAAIPCNNTHLVESQLQLCRFLYHMAQNIECFLLPAQERSKLALTLLKFLLKTIKALEDGRFGAEKIINFDQYKASAQYAQLYDEIRDCAARYQKSYLDHIKATDIHTIRTVNSMFPQLTNTSQLLDNDFCLRLKVYLQTIAKENTLALNTIIQDDGEEDCLGQKLEAFQNIIILQRLLEQRSRQQSQSSFPLPTLGNYSNSPLRKSDYLNLRKQMKYI